MHARTQTADPTYQSTYRNSFTDVILWVGTLTLFLVAFWPSL
jgi:hypothetical protein